MHLTTRLQALKLTTRQTIYHNIADGRGILKCFISVSFSISCVCFITDSDYFQLSNDVFIILHDFRLDFAVSFVAT